MFMCDISTLIIIRLKYSENYTLSLVAEITKSKHVLGQRSMLSLALWSPCSLDTLIKFSYNPISLS